MLGHPLKLIAYELGLSVSTVSGALKRALVGLGVRSVQDVLTMLTPPSEP
jgi:DNA-binding CsgD family transcriptional regulator